MIISTCNYQLSRKRKRNQYQKKRKMIKEEEEINRLLFSIMDGYSDQFIAPLSDFSPLMEDPSPNIAVVAAATAAIVEEKGASSSRKRGRPKVEEDHDYEVAESLKKERERRGKMTESYDHLLSMLPNLLPKATKERIVGETITYIKELEKEIEILEQLKKNSSCEPKRKNLDQYYSNRDSSINVTVSNNVVFFGIQALVRPSLVTDIFMVFHKHKAELMAANVAINDQRQLTLTVTAKIVNVNNTIEKIKRDILILVGI